MRSGRGLIVLAMALAACGGEASVGAPGLAERAYVVSQDSDELTVIDLRTLAVAARVPTLGRGNHMVEVSRDGARVYVTSAGTDEVIVVDAETLRPSARIAVGRHPTHLGLSRDGRLLVVMAEGDDAVSIVDVDGAREVARLSGFVVPHAVRFAPDERTAYVANAGASHLTVVDLDDLAVAGEIALPGTAVPTPVDGEGGFHDAQIDAQGVLYAAHAASGRVLVVDTATRAAIGEIAVGGRPWAVFAESPFPGMARRYLAPSVGAPSLALVDGETRALASSLPGDLESYGVNVSPLAPGRAYVMERSGRSVGVVDTTAGVIVDHLDVGGTPETASTTADGRFVLATVSSRDAVVVIDAAAGRVATVIEGVGAAPWSIAVPAGQNYCH